jgi:hypothetical protein
LIFILLLVILLSSIKPSSKLTANRMRDQSDNIKVKPVPRPYSADLITETTDQQSLSLKWNEMFREIGLKHGTDKVSAHSYHNFYGVFLGPIKHKVYKILFYFIKFIFKYKKM